MFNVACGVETSLNDLAKTLLEVMGSDLPVEYGPPRAVNGVTRRLADISQAEKRLGFKAEMQLREGLADLVAWWRSRAGGRGRVRAAGGVRAVEDVFVSSAVATEPRRLPGSR